jgi:hypothetical protein
MSAKKPRALPVRPAPRAPQRALSRGLNMHDGSLGDLSAVARSAKAERGRVNQT